MTRPLPFTVPTDGEFVRLERLSRKAANDSLRNRGGHLADDQFDALAVHLLTIGINAYQAFNPTLTVSDRDGYSYAYRAMRGYRQHRFTDGPYIDWLRSNICDTRFEPATTTTVTRDGTLPESAAVDTGSYDAAIHELGRDLSTRALWTLHHIATPNAEWGRSRRSLADTCPICESLDPPKEHNLTVREVRQLLAELEAELNGEQPPAPEPELPVAPHNLLEFVA